jgi:DHA1 family bicyclomycin/chloramphenicol resistance-like MFS transporter
MAGVVLSMPLSAPLLSLLFLLLTTSLGFLMPNIAALAFGHIRERMGSASALQGTIQSLAGGIAGVSIGLLSDGSVWPVIMVVGGWGILANLLWQRARATTATQPASV